MRPLGPIEIGPGTWFKTSFHVFSFTSIQQQQQQQPQCIFNKSVHAYMLMYAITTRFYFLLQSIRFLKFIGNRRLVFTGVPFLSQHLRHYYIHLAPLPLTTTSCYFHFLTEKESLWSLFASIVLLKCLLLCLLFLLFPIAHVFMNESLYFYWNFKPFFLSKQLSYLSLCTVW